jgi:Kef-type K+ transport system membrane component KefB
LFTPAVIGALNGIAWWAVMLFVFVAGLELDLGEAWRSKGDAFTTAGLALAVPMALGAAVAAALLQLSDPGLWIGAKGQSWQFVLGIGMACAVTALPILVLFLQKLGILRTALGQRILRYASLDDIMVWGVLAFILLDWERITRQAGFVIGFGVAVWAMRKLIAAIPERDRWYCALIWLAGCGFLADWAGLHYMVGAFLAGAALEARWFTIEAIDRFRDVVLLAFMPVFFLSTGLRTSWEMGGWIAFAAAAALLAAMVVGKLIGVAIAGRLRGWAKGEAWTIGWLLQTKALIMIIFVNVLFDRQIITSGAFTALLLAAVGSTMLTIPIVSPALRKLGDVGQHHR